MRAPWRALVPVLAASVLACGAQTAQVAEPPPAYEEPAPEPPAPAEDAPPTVIVAPTPAAEPSASAADPAHSSVTFTTPAGRPVTLRWKREARSVGHPAHGRLENGRCTRPEGPGYVQFSPNNCGTDEVVTLTLFAIGEVLREVPDTVSVVIGSLSKPGGGRLKPHKSHRTGRDIDIGFYAANNRAMKTFETLAIDDIDYAKSFLLMANLIATGRVQWIFVNYRLQPYLYEAAKSMGYDEEQLAYLFEYPRGRKSRQGVIRHARGHTRHFHVRFACPEGDAECVD